MLVSPKIRGKARQRLIGAARAGEDLDEGQARYVRVIEYEVPDRDGDGKGEVIALVTTITEVTAAPAPLLAEAYHQRWEHETGNKQLKTFLRGPGRVLRSKSPDMVRQEIYGGCCVVPPSGSVGAPPGSARGQIVTARLSKAAVRSLSPAGAWVAIS